MKWQQTYVNMTNIFIQRSDNAYFQHCSHLRPIIMHLFAKLSFVRMTFRWWWPAFPHWPIDRLIDRSVNGWWKENGWLDGYAVAMLVEYHYCLLTPFIVVAVIASLLPLFVIINYYYYYYVTIITINCYYYYYYSH